MDAARYCLNFFRRIGLAETLLRGAALFLGSFLLLGWLLYLTQSGGYDASVWWFDLRGLPFVLSAGLSVVFALALLHRAVLSNSGRVVAGVRSAVLGVLAFELVMNTLAALRLHRAIEDQASSGVWLGVPVPLTAVVAVGVLLMLRRPAVSVATTRAARVRRCLGVCTCAAFFGLLAALAQMFWFGESDYRRPADAILVYGCKAYADGTPSQALADRVHTACELYHQGLAPTIVMSGGPVNGSDLHEPQAMADYAVSLGVPRSAIVLDPMGMDTRATADNFTKVFSDAPGSGDAGTIRVLAVSHDYHLPRVKLSLERRGIRAYTVPAEIRRGLPSKPYLMARETAAWWYYYFRPLASLRH